MPAACSDHAHESCRTPQTRESSVRARAEPSARSPCSLRVSTLPSCVCLYAMLTATVLVHVQVSGCFEVLCIHHGWGEGFGLEGHVREVT